MDCIADQVESRQHTDMAASSRFGVQQKSQKGSFCCKFVTDMFLHLIISQIPEFGLPKFRNFGMYKRPKIPELRSLDTLIVVDI